MTETSQLPEEGKSEAEAVKTSEKIQKKIAKIVRENSQNLGKKIAVASLRGTERAQYTVSALTGVSSLGTLLPDLGPEKLEANLAEMLKEEAPEPEKVETEPAKDEAVEAEPVEAVKVEPAKAEAEPARKIKENKFKDIKSVVVTATGARYLYSEMYIARGYAEFLARAEATRILVAEKVRETSEKLGELTTVSSLDSLASALEPGELDVHLAGLAMDERFKDIKSLVALTGTRYLYSDAYITRERAEAIARAEVIKAGIAKRVRETSRNLAELTTVSSLMEPVPAPEPAKAEAEPAKDEAVEAEPVKTEAERIEAARAEAEAAGPDLLSTLVPPLEPGELDVSLAEMAKDERFKDIKSLVVSTGAVYLYSETFISKTYAGLLLRAEVNDPFATIAETVRDESRIYPRPTNIYRFNVPVFNIDPAELLTHIARMLEREEYKDIKMVHASNGVPFLYSNLYMEEPFAIGLAEWEAVEDEENP